MASGKVAVSTLPAPAAIVLAAGLGTRMHSGRAKVLHAVGGEPMIVRALRPLVAAGASPIVVVIGHQAEEVQAAVHGAFPRDFDIRFARQSVQRGTGDAARCGIEALPAGLETTVVIINGDMPRLRARTVEEFIARHRAAGAALSLITLELADPGNYGRIVRGADGGVEAIVEARDASAEQRALREINTGLYAGQIGHLRRALASLQADNAQGELYLTDTVAITRAGGLAVAGFKADGPAEFAGINSLEELAQVDAEIRNAVNRRLMAAGVTLVDPATAYIGEQVEIGADSVIGPNVQILGRSRIGAGVRIDGTAWLDGVEIGDGCHLKLGVRAEHCRMGPHCEVGPFANLREGTDLAGDNRIGNFVETKAAKIGRGTKASHLSYLGDVTIGVETNIGCGVITVNYDGYHKHRSEIGDRCMVGCDSQLIAPVRVGDDAYVASGTTVLRDVAPGALVTSVHPQRQREGWTESWRRRHQAASGNS
jgi:bifunctional UDP-N-acetylglucosamine pyrophosphorylase/glucosamine-1-phosphate N-acetyltransferase